MQKKKRVASYSITLSENIGRLFRLYSAGEKCNERGLHGSGNHTVRSDRQLAKMFGSMRKLCMQRMPVSLKG
ncbi:hypothetical protein MKW98_013188 [Papaver atlanticum]|uniref:Uncharacterized protein n=1 Tax=Papaver atlanticum TaxID=357466 RepID=A0AAD4XSC6_9MAGN|nr:hypothetical protein MKW98_013188 [Papaver atlanticum]